MYCIGVDTRGIMTDTLVSGGEVPLLIKVGSTPHAVTVLVMESYVGRLNSWVTMTRGG